MTPAKKKAEKGLENENESKNLRPIEQNRFEAFGVSLKRFKAVFQLLHSTDKKKGPHQNDVTLCFS
ncbi:MAG: hypothetical protein EGQ34_07655 [Sutterella sp.]|nr:hypothetical protein [Sutterella sp.]